MTNLKKSAKPSGALSVDPLCFGMEKDEGGALYSRVSLPLLKDES